MCEEYETFDDRTRRPVVMGQSIVLSALKKEVPLHSETERIKHFLLQQYEEYELKSCHNKTNWANCVWMQGS